MNWRRMKTDALSAVDTAIGIVDRIPDVEDEANSDFSYEKSANPFPFLIDLIRRIRGYDYVIKLIARFIAYVLPAVEVSAKAILIANLKNLLYCTIDPLLRRNDVLRDGITISVGDIDLLNTLDKCPLKTNSVLGAAPQAHSDLYYFGCDGFEFPSQLVDAGDFNAFLWYVMNRTNKRVVWRGTSLTRNLAQSAEMFGVKPTESFLYQKTLAERPSGSTPDTEENGILTIIYYQEGETPRDAKGLPLRKLTFNPAGLLHVYIGNTTNTTLDDKSFIEYENAYQQKCVEVTTLQQEIASLKNDKAKIEKKIQKKINPENLEEQKATLVRITKSISEKEQQSAQLSQMVTTMATEYQRRKELRVEPYGESDYRPIETNYYYDKTLMKFNYDYIMSIKLFDSKVVAAQLIDSLLNMSSSGNLRISYERRVIEEEVKKMLNSILERGTTTISDCFFAFSNEEIDNLQRKVELQRAGLYSRDGEDNYSNIIDADMLLNNLNNIASNATQEEVQSVIEGTLMEVSKEIDGGVEKKVEDHMNGEVKWNFVKQLMENLLTVIVETICSPKVYLVYLINMEMLGKYDKNLNLQNFLKSKGELIASITSEIANIWADFLLTEFNKLKAEIYKIVKQKLVDEQYEYYKRLLKQCIECFKTNKDYLDFNLDDVDYADILQEEEAPSEDNNC